MLHVATERLALAAARLGVVAPPLPLPLYDAYFGAMAGRAIVAACSTGIADTLPGTVDEVAERRGLDPIGVDLVLRALRTLGYVRFRGGRYRLARAGRWMERDRLGEMLGDFVPDAWESLSGLEDVLRGGSPGGLHERPPDDPFWGRYERAMGQLSAFAADPFAAAVPVRSPRHLLDLGGGVGAYAAALRRRFPELRATIVELPGAAAVGRADVEYLEGSVFDVDLPHADLITINNVLHTLDCEASLRLLGRAREALEPHGVLAMLEVDAPEPGRVAVQFAALASLVFYASGGTRSWTARELEAMTAEAGFERVRTLRPVRLPGNMIVVGRAAA